VIIPPAMGGQVPHCCCIHLLSLWASPSQLVAAATKASDLLQIIVLPAQFIPAAASTRNPLPIAALSGQHHAVTSDDCLSNDCHTDNQLAVDCLNAKDQLAINDRLTNNNCLNTDNQLAVDCLNANDRPTDNHLDANDPLHMPSSAQPTAAALPGHLAAATPIADDPLRIASASAQLAAEAMPSHATASLTTALAAATANTSNPCLIATSSAQLTTATTNASNALWIINPLQIIMLPSQLTTAAANDSNPLQITNQLADSNASVATKASSDVTVVVASSSDANATVSNCATQLPRVALTTSYPLQIVLSPGQQRTVASNNCLAKDCLANNHITTDDPTAALPSQRCAVITIDCLAAINGLTAANGLAAIDGPTIVCHTDNQLASINGLATVNGLIIKQRAPIEPTTAHIEPTMAPIEPMMAPIKPTMALIEPMMAPIKLAMHLIKPMLAPIKPTTAPIKPTMAPIEPTTAPIIKLTTASIRPPGQHQRFTSSIEPRAPKSRRLPSS
jgi:hypothetical protein